MIFWRTKIECFHALGCPWAAGVPIFVRHCFAPEWGKTVSVPILCAIQNLVCQHCGINTQCVQHVDGVLDLRGKSIPQLEWELAVCSPHSSNERRFEHFNRLLGGIHSMIVGFNELQVAIVFGKDFFDVLRCLFVHDVQFLVEALSYPKELWKQRHLHRPAFVRLASYV